MILHSEELTLAILRRIESTPNQKSLADTLGFSVGKVNYVIKALIDKGFVKADNFISNPNKSQYRYLLTQKGLEEKITLTQRFIIKKKQEYVELQHELEMMGRLS